ncbi:MAG: phosphoglycolate phosphatase, partial [Gammaproteobacteria bacterium]
MFLNHPEMVLLDLDGTLVDTVPDLSYCLDNMLREFSLPEAGE